MALQKLSDTATTKTHGAVDADLIDIINPTVPLAGSLENVLRSGLYGLGGWVLRGKRLTGSFSI